MQTDMHYYGTYAMAMAAGLKEEIAARIAFCAEFVDENIDALDFSFRDGALFKSQPTAHHYVDRHNTDKLDQLNLWVPFHFLPGAEGEEYTERLICRTDSKVARCMVEHYLSELDRPYLAELMGVCAHVYADTFAHYGFSGVSSRRNRVEQSSISVSENMSAQITSYMASKADSFFDWYKDKGAGLWENIKGGLAEIASGALGHGGAATYPDRPFVEWSFFYEFPARRQETRNNVLTFQAGAQALHGMFARLGVARPEYRAVAPAVWSDIAGCVSNTLRVQAPLEGRVAAWQKAAQSGRLGRQFEIPAYDPKPWKEPLDALNGGAVSSLLLPEPLFRFYQATEHHRTFVLKDLLPRFGIVAC